MNLDKEEGVMAAKPLEYANEVGRGLEFKNQVVAPGGRGHDVKTVQENPNLRDESIDKVRPKPLERGGFGHGVGPHEEEGLRSEGGLGVGISQRPNEFKFAS